MIRQAFTQCREAVSINIFEKFASAACLASEAAIPTVNSWICHRNDGGVAWATFRATCSREYAPNLVCAPRPPILMLHAVEFSTVQKVRWISTKVSEALAEAVLSRSAHTRF